MIDFQITATTKALQNALSLLTRVIPVKSSNPTLTSVHAKVHQSGLTLTGTNLEMDLRVTVPAEVPLATDTAFTVPAYLLGQIVNKLPGDLVVLRFASSTRTLHIESGNSKSKLQIGAAENYPMPALDDGPGYTTEAAALAQAIGDLTPLVGRDKVQIVLTGMSFEFSPERTRLVASGGFWVIYEDIDPLPGLTEPRKVQVNYRNLDMLSMVLNTAKTASIHLSQAVLSVKTQTIHLQIRLMEGEYVAYERHIPRTSKIQAVFPVSSMQEVLTRALTFSEGSVNQRLDLRIGGDGVRLQAANEYGGADEELPATISGSEPAMDVMLNATQFQNLLKAMSGEVTFSLSGSDAPYLLNCTGNPRRVGFCVTLREATA